jgi:hypothetical protein
MDNSRKRRPTPVHNNRKQNRSNKTQKKQTSGNNEKRNGNKERMRDCRIVV